MSTMWPWNVAQSYGMFFILCDHTTQPKITTFSSTIDSIKKIGSIRHLPSIRIHDGTSCFRFIPFLTSIKHTWPIIDTTELNLCFFFSYFWSTFLVDIYFKNLSWAHCFNAFLTSDSDMKIGYGFLGCTF
jgi:hypothetical protein